jgi:hypothetical protein
MKNIEIRIFLWRRAWLAREAGNLTTIRKAIV